jgi:surfactin synthase thioesterase subunit
VCSRTMTEVARVSGRWLACRERPFAFFGHSLGALVAYEVARALRAAGLRQPDRLFASACPAPHLPRTETPIHQLSDEELVAWIDQEYRSLPPEIIGNPDLMRIVLPAHRSDFELVETYEYRTEEPLECPITVVGGTEDELTESELAAWSRHTVAGWDLHWLTGGHFYLREEHDVLLHLVREKLQVVKTDGV